MSVGVDRRVSEEGAGGKAPNRLHRLDGAEDVSFRVLRVETVVFNKIHNGAR